MTIETVDAVVVGAGPNGLVAANALVDAGWDVVVLEANDTIGGAVRSAEIVAPGYVTDLFSAFYPLAAASPVIQGLHLEQHGLRWEHADKVLAHVLDDGRSVALSRDIDATAGSVETFGAGDGDSWKAMYEGWLRVRDSLLDALFTPFPPVSSVIRLVTRLGIADTLDFARLAVLPVRRLAAEEFAGAGAGLLLTGNALHADIGPDAAGSGVFGWLLTMLGQDVGFPVPRGGAQQLANAFGDRLSKAGGTVRTGERAETIEIEGGRAIGVRTREGRVVRARRAVLADVSAPALYRRLVGEDRLPRAFVHRLSRFEWDPATIKLNWALDRPVPWASDGAVGAGTVHLGVDRDGFVDFAADLSVGRMPQRPFLLFGQMTTADPSRSPAGTESAWAYTHVPRADTWPDGKVDDHVARMEHAIERVAPGFGDRVVGRQVQSPADLAEADVNLEGGAVNGGTAAIHQQLLFRPTTGTGRPETPIPGLYLASAAVHPGGGVHGACGWNAARAALAAAGPTGAVRRALAKTAWGRLTRRP